MARLERGKGKRMDVIEVVRHGRMLRSQEDAGGDYRLPGWRRFESDAAAQAGLVAEVKRLLADKMRPGDDEAHAIAATVPSKKAGPPTLPIRVDVAVYNEANGFVCTARRMAGKTIDEGTDEWRKAVKKGDMLPMSLVQDDPFVVRVVVGDALTDAEEAEWVARVDWHLNIPDGKLCITGGAVFTNTDYDDGDPYYEQYVAEVAVPKGRYRAQLYSLMHGINGSGVIDTLAGGQYDSGEPIEAWWARTRGGEPLPTFDDDADVIGFLLRLEPIDAAPKTGLDKLPDEGWFGGAENARKPDLAPRGLLGVNVERRAREGAGGWTYVRDVPEMLGDRTAKMVRGGPVTIPLAELPLVARLAWFGSRWTAFGLGVTPPDGVGDVTTHAWPDMVMPAVEGGAQRLHFSADLDSNDAIRTLASIVEVIARWPSGTKLELLSAPVGAMQGEPGDEGRMRTSGTVRDGQWSITGSWPQVDAATLTAAIGLAREATAKGTLQEAIKTFESTYGSTWAVTKSVDEDDDDDDDGMFPTEPIRGAHILDAPSGRAYLQTMAMLLSEDVAEGIKAKERSLLANGWKFCGDLFTEQFEYFAIRGSTIPGSTTWAVLFCKAPTDVDIHLVSLFEQGGMLVTSADGNARDKAEQGVFRTGLAGANTRDLLAAHAERLAELTATRGPARVTEVSIYAFAAAVDPILDAIAY